MFLGDVALDGLEQLLLRALDDGAAHAYETCHGA
jgi:hypothetical protein